MPKLTRYFIKSAVINFVLGLLLGLLLACESPLDLPSWIVYLNPVYIHLFMVGWITQMIIGVSLWLFPASSKENAGRNEKLGWICFGCLNAGLILRFVSEPMTEIDPMGPWPYVLIFSGLLHGFAGLLYVSNIWIRVRGK